MIHRRTLAIDTSTKSQVLALLDADDVVTRRLTRVRTNHSETLLRNIDDAIGQLGWSRSDLDLVAVGLGPGTFTGLRVGLATAKALAVGLDADLVGVSSLAATARPVSSLFDGTVFALCDARRGEVYCARYRTSRDRFECTSPARAMSPEAVLEEVESMDGPVALIGNGLRAFEELRSPRHPGAVVLSQAWDGPSAASIGLLGRQRASTDGPDDIASLEPDYVRLSDAEVNRGAPEAERSELK